MNKKVAVYLTGAGGKAPFQIGFLKAIDLNRFHNLIAIHFGY